MAAAQLHALFREDWAWELRDNPEFASQAGAHDTPFVPGTALQHVDWASYLARAAHSTQMVERVQAIVAQAKDGELSKADQIFAALFKDQHEQLARAVKSCPLFLIPVNSTGTGGICNSFVESVEWMRFETRHDYDVLLARLRECPRQIDEFVAAMKEGVAQGYVASTAVMFSVDGALEALAAGDGPFAELRDALDKLPAVVSADEVPALEQELSQAVAACRQAYGKLLVFVRGEYASTLRTDAGLSSLPCGAAGYDECLRYHTTTTLTADQIHAIGLEEVARLEARYVSDVLQPLGFGSDFARFAAHAHSEPRFYVDTPAALLAHYTAVCEDIKRVLPSYFAEFPQSPLEIVATLKGPAAFYLAGTTDGKRPGRFYVNVDNLPSHPTYEAMALSLHEAIPGHHHQVSLALENASVPECLRFVEDRRYEACPSRRQLYCAFCEGWALYCELLGEEMGLYKTPYDVFGRLSMDMMRAVRLVVDTGLHSKGWSVDAAIKYMMEKTGMHHGPVEREIRRYAAWPGQACAYKIGQLEIVRLRRKAEAALGDAFSIKEFHTLCLTSGPLTMSLLADLVDGFIQQRRK